MIEYEKLKLRIIIITYDKVQIDKYAENMIEYEN